jgi:tetratricopeptide (TPR) repeat protein
MNKGPRQIPGSPLNPGRITWPRGVVLAFACALVIAAYAWIATSGAIELLSSGARGTYYNLLVEGFRAGQLNLKTAVPPGLAQLGDPLDPDANAPYRWVDGNPLHDLSFHRGKFYLYFGPSPAVALFWPCAALTGHYLWHTDGAVIFFSAGFLAGAALLLAVWSTYFGEVRFWILVSGVLAFGLANLVTAVLTRSDVYEVAIGCGYAMTMLALVAVWGSMHDARRTVLWLAAASVAWGLALGARPSLLPGAAVLLAPVIHAWVRRRRVWPLWIAAILPVSLFALGLMYYNFLRFGSPFEFGQHYQLSAARPDTGGQFSLRYFWFNIRVAFFDPARWSPQFPYVRDAITSTPPDGATVEHAFGVLANLPFTWLALALPLAWRGRAARTRPALLCLLGAICWLFGTNALLLCLHDSMCLRYQVEFVPELVFLAVVGIFVLESSLAAWPVWRRIARCLWVLLLACSLGFNLFASFEMQALAHSNIGFARSRQGRFGDAALEYLKAADLTDHAEFYAAAGNCLLRQKRMDAAAPVFQKALALQPDSGAALEGLAEIAWVQATSADSALRNDTMALELASQVDRMSGGTNAGAAATLGAAYAAGGRFGDAIVAAQRAHDLATRGGDASRAAGIEAQLKLYQAGSPLRIADPGQ